MSTSRTVISKDNAAWDSLILNEVARIGSTYFDFEKVALAITFASILHNGQTRMVMGKTERTPYIQHPLQNAYWLLEKGCLSEDVLIAEILHDTVEDCKDKFISLAEYRSYIKKNPALDAFGFYSHEFNSNVARIVKAVTNTTLPRSMSKAEKRAFYVVHVISVISDVEVFLTKLADFINNAGNLSFHYSKNGGEVTDTQLHLALKYFPLCAIFIRQYGLLAKDLPFTVESLANNTILDELNSIQDNLEKMIASRQTS